MVLRRGLGVSQCNIVTRMSLATIALLCKQTTDNLRTRPSTRTAHGAIYRVTVYYLFLIKTYSKRIRREVEISYNTYEDLLERALNLYESYT